MIKFTRLIEFIGVNRRVFLYASLVLCIFSIVLYTTIYNTKNRHNTETNHILILDNNKLLLENKKMLLNSFTSKKDTIYEIYKVILINDSIIFENMKKLKDNYKE
jgi:hypothetical protein